MDDLISRQAAIDELDKGAWGVKWDKVLAKTMIESLPSAQPDRELIEQLRWERDTAIQQLKDLGYGFGEKPKTDDTISRQDAIDALLGITAMKNTIPLDSAIFNIKRIPAADVVEVTRCRDCKHFEYDHPYVIQGVPVLGHLVCNRWGDGCKTDEDGFCFMGERREDE